MHVFRQVSLVAVALSLPAVAIAQDVAPFFEQVPAVLVDTYEGVNGPLFNEYFEMLVNRDQDEGEVGWSIYSRSATTALRVTALPEGLESMLEILGQRQTGFQDFNEDQVALWSSAWGSRAVSVWNAAPGLSVVPEGFTGADMAELPFTRVIIYEVAWDQAPAFRAALRERSALDREAGLGNNFVLTVWNGGIGTRAQTIALRISAASRAADAGPNGVARRAAREGFQAERARLSGLMNAAATSVVGHEERFRQNLSFTPGS
jgi:hypothetical protein